MAITKGTSVALDLNLATSRYNPGGAEIWRKKTLSENTIMQSFAVDYRKSPKDIFVAQCKQGGTSPDKGASQGDITINRLDHYGNRISNAHCVANNEDWTGSSSLKHQDEFIEFHYQKNGVAGWGHGTQIGMEYAPDHTYLWVDLDSPAADRVKNKAAGYDDYYMVGKKLARIRYIGGGQSMGYGHEHMRQWTPSARIPGVTYSDFLTCSYDNVNDVMAVKYTDQSGKMKLSLMKVDYTKYRTTLVFSDIIYTHLKTIDVPGIRWNKASKTGWGKKSWGNLTPNGWAIFGDYVYFMYGTAYFNTDTSLGQQDWYAPSPADVTKGSYYYNESGSLVKATKAGNIHLRRVNWVTGAVQTSFTEAGAEIPWRESEGMHIIPTQNAAGDVTKLELLFGLVGGPRGDRDMSICVKTQNL